MCIEYIARPTKRYKAQKELAMSSPIITPSRRILRLPEVMASVGFGRAHIYNLIAIGRFPKAKRIGVRAVGWDSREIEIWITQHLEG